MGDLIRKILDKWGTELVLRQAGSELRLKALLFHSGSKSWRNMQNAYSPLGKLPNGQYVYIGPVQPAAAAGDTLILGDKVYTLRRVERVWLQDTPLYCWGLCVEKEGAV